MRDVIDLTDPELYARGDPHAVWRHLRAESPVYWHPQSDGPGFWALTRYDDIVGVSTDPHTFASAGGTSTQGTQDPVRARMLVLMDPPVHGPMRAVVSRGFRPRAVARLEPFVREVASRVVDEAASQGRCDFVADVAARLPFTVICELLGVPDRDRPALLASVSGLMETDAVRHDPLGGVDLVRYFTGLAAERRYRPREDLVSAVVADDGLDDTDVLALCVLLFVAGSETTMNAASGAALAFVHHPDQRGPVTTAMVEEILRYTSPVLNSMIRTATRDTEIRGTPIRAGQKVTLWYPSANRDESVFDRPDDFDVTRSPNDHIVFGFGEHFCLGASLARLEIRVLFEELFDRLPAWRLDGEVVRLRSNTMQAIERMPVRW